MTEAPAAPWTPRRPCVPLIPRSPFGPTGPIGPWGPCVVLADAETGVRAIHPAAPTTDSPTTESDAMDLDTRRCGRLVENVAIKFDPSLGLSNTDDASVKLAPAC